MIRDIIGGSESLVLNSRNQMGQENESVYEPTCEPRCSCSLTLSPA